MPTALQMLCHSERFADTEAARASVERMCEHRIRMVRTLLMHRRNIPHAPAHLKRPVTSIAKTGLRNGIVLG
jgi:hypothetical protein